MIQILDCGNIDRQEMMDPKRMLKKVGSLAF